MKKVFFSFAVAAMAVMMVSCGGNTNADADKDSVAVETEAEAEEVEATEPEASAAVEDRGWYTVEIPAGFEATQNESEMAITGPVELNIKEQADADVAEPPAGFAFFDSRFCTNASTFAYMDSFKIPAFTRTCPISIESVILPQ